MGAGGETRRVVEQKAKLKVDPPRDADQIESKRSKGNGDPGWKSPPDVFALRSPRAEGVEPGEGGRREEGGEQPVGGCLRLGPPSRSACFSETQFSFSLLAALGRMQIRPLLLSPPASLSHCNRREFVFSPLFLALMTHEVVLAYAFALLCMTTDRGCVSQWLPLISYIAFTYAYVKRAASDARFCNILLYGGQTGYGPPGLLTSDIFICATSPYHITACTDENTITLQ